MDGIIVRVSATGGNTNTSAEPMSPDVINAMVKQVYDDGGTDMGSRMILACNQVQMQKISAFDKDKIQTVPGAGIRGQYVTQFLSDLNVVVDFVVDRWVPQDVALLLDTSRIQVVPLQGRGFGVQEIAKTGDSDKAQIIGDYTLEIRNALQAHAIHTNLTV
jgi:hypothetical protein